jgi:hypothetical protein
MKIQEHIVSTVIDEIAVYEKVLDAEEVAELHDLALEEVPSVQTMSFTADREIPRIIGIDDLKFRECWHDNNFKSVSVKSILDMPDEGSFSIRREVLHKL